MKEKHEEAKKEWKEYVDEIKQERDDYYFDYHETEVNNDDTDEADDISEQVITIEEDGRLGNLLMETATLLLIGKKLNKQVQILPQVDKKLKNYFHSLPTQALDHRKVHIFKNDFLKNII